MRVGGTNSRRSRATHRSRKPALNEHPLKSRPSGTDGHADRRNRHRRPRDRDPRRTASSSSRATIAAGRRRRDPPRGVPRPRATRYRHRRPRAGRRPRALGAVARPRDRRRRRPPRLAVRRRAPDGGRDGRRRDPGRRRTRIPRMPESGTTTVVDHLSVNHQRRRSRPRSRRGSAHDSERC